MSKSPHAVGARVTTAIVWAVSAVVGLFFCGRGSTGLIKGLTVSGAAILCLAPYLVLVAPTARDALTSALSLAPLFLSLGFAFDAVTFNENTDAGSMRRRLRDFAYLEGLPGLTTFATTIAASAGSAAVSVVSGQSSSLATQAVKLLLPGISSVGKP